MLKKKVSLVAVVAVLLVSAIGYALFSQTINITGSARAQGDFSITAKCMPGVPNSQTATADFPDLVSKYAAVNDTLEEEKGTSNESCTVSGNNISYSATLKYPGAFKYFTVKFTNTGMVAASLDPTTGISFESGTICIDGTKKTNNNNVANGTIETASECYNIIPGGGDTVLPADMIYSTTMVDPTAASHGVFQKDSNNNNALVHQDEAGASAFFDETDPDSPVIVLRPGESLFLLYSIAFDGLFPYDKDIHSFLFSQSSNTKYLFNQYND